jgi:glycosidase
VVWAGNMSIHLEGFWSGPNLARAYVGPGRPPAEARVRVEFFMAAVDARQVREGDVDVRLWTDANQRGELDEQGTFHNSAGYCLPMHLVADPEGAPVLSGNNLVFESEPFALHATGVFNYTAEFSADACALGDPDKQWIVLNDMARNQDGVIVVSPAWVVGCPSLVEVCARKVGAGIEDGRFRSGRLAEVTRQLESLPADIVYLLPFSKPGFTDLHTGEDVRKGTLGSVYAVADFLQVDPELVTPPEEADLEDLVATGLIQDSDLGAMQAADLVRLDLQQVLARVGREQLVQVIGRAELRGLVRRAHSLGKRVIFDLVLMQTSRDNPLILEHPEWYVRDPDGRPSIHRIAWLVYSDVALFALVFNLELQDYLLGIAPYWMEQCGLDGVRIDASQTVDRPFLKRLKNRIDAVQPDALVLGETLCPLDQALDIPVDMIYALLVDFHRDAEHAGPLVRFLDEMHSRIAHHTVALAYFENHDSPRATQVWRRKYAACLAQDAEAAQYWRGLECRVQADLGQRALLMALLKNLQATLIDLTAGLAPGANLAYGLELGSDWGEETRTDFENETLLHPHLREQQPHATLVRAYQWLRTQSHGWPELAEGMVYYQRNESAGGDPEDRVLGYVRHTDRGALLVLHNLDPARAHGVVHGFEFLPWKPRRIELLLDTYQLFQIAPPAAPGSLPDAPSTGRAFRLLPLQSQVLRLSP